MSKISTYFQLVFLSIQKDFFANWLFGSQSESPIYKAINFANGLSYTES